MIMKAIKKIGKKIFKMYIESVQNQYEHYYI